MLARVRYLAAAELQPLVDSSIAVLPRPHPRRVAKTASIAALTAQEASEAFSARIAAVAQAF